jgi:hypothetical protein
MVWLDNSVSKFLTTIPAALRLALSTLCLLVSYDLFLCRNWNASNPGFREIFTEIQQRP